MERTDYRKILVDGNPDFNYQPGDKVFDELTSTICKVIKTYPKVGIDAWQGNWIKITSPYLDGDRHPWEITKVERNVGRTN
jgi:hypothetical protein